MRPQDLDRLAEAAELSYAGALKELAPIEAERRRLAAAREKALSDAAVMADADDVGPNDLVAADLMAAAAARRAALTRAGRLDAALGLLRPALDAARRKVKKALAKTEVVAELQRRQAREARRMADRR